MKSIILVLLALSVFLAGRLYRLERVYKATLEAYAVDLALMDCLDHSRPCSKSEVAELKAQSVSFTTN